MIELQCVADTAILVHVAFSSAASIDTLTEFKNLVHSAGVAQAMVVNATRKVPDARYYVGMGKAQEILTAVQLHAATVVIFNNPLTPAQERNLERLLQCRVMDRARLILDIFALRARSFEGKLQVELAQLQHMSTRLVRGWTHLERQKGGIGLRGPGETQLETDRRLLRVRLKKITAQLEKVRQQRELGRQARRKADIPMVSLVGYTNAGKSTLFNALAQAETYVADQLFATLDPTLRRVEFAHGHALVLVDTVGFIRELPHDLVIAFRATLEETRYANLLVHVIDVGAAERTQQMEEVNNVLRAIGAAELPMLEVYNKIDQLEHAVPTVERDAMGRPCRVYLSAHTGIGINLLQEAITELVYDHMLQREICLTSQQGRLRAQLYAHHAVLSEQIDAAGNWLLLVRLPHRDFVRLGLEL